MGCKELGGNSELDHEPRVDAEFSVAKENQALCGNQIASHHGVVRAWRLAMDVLASGMHGFAFTPRFS